MSVFNSSLSAEFSWEFETKTIDFNKFAVIYKLNDSTHEFYFIPKGIINKLEYLQ